MTRIPSLGPRGEGWVALQGSLIALLVVSGNVGPPIGPLDRSTGMVVNAVGWLALGVGLGLIAFAMVLLRRSKALTAVPRPRDEGSLVVSGPYRFIRHPVYAGLILACLGVAFTRLSWIDLGLPTALFVVLDLKRRREEAWLGQRYPDYDAYRGRTKGLVPFLY